MNAVMPGPPAFDKAPAADDLLPRQTLTALMPPVPMPPGTPVPLYCLRDSTGAPYGHLEQA